MSGGHKALKTINNWPEESRKNITMMIASAQQIAIKINGLNETRYKVNVKQDDKVVCQVYPNRIEWMPGTEIFQSRYYPNSETVQKIEEAFNPVRITENDINDDLLANDMFTMAILPKRD
jgi:hypothetical protein